MDATDLTRAAFQPSHRSKVIAALRGDPVFLSLARAELQRLVDGHSQAMLLDRDHISRAKHDFLVSALAQVEAARPIATVEPASQ